IYPAADDAGVQGAQALLFSDIFFSTTREHARQMAAVQPKTFVYLFTRLAKPMVESKWGVYHGSELPLYFGTMIQDWYVVKAGDYKAAFSKEDEELSRLIRVYLLNFARTGNPNAALAPQAPPWPAYKLGEEKHAVLDTPISVDEKLHARRLDAL